MTLPAFRWTEDQEAAIRLLGGPARHTMLYGGSRSGKTFVLCGAVVMRALKAQESRHAIFRHRFNHLKISIGLDTLPKVMKLRFPDVSYKIDKTDWVVRLGNKSEIWLAGLDDKERTEKILGQEYSTLYFNECSQIAYSAVIMARTRLAQKTALINRAYYDCNPPGSKHWTAMVFVSGKDPASRPVGQPLPNFENFKAMVMNPNGNRQNLSEEYIAELEALPERQRNRFLLGKFTAELDNALWTVDGFKRRLTEDPVTVAEDCDRVVVSVDPSGASGPEDKRSDEIGIMVAGRRRSNKGYVVLADRTLRGGPGQWARAAISAYKDFKADAIVAERNFGGAMVSHTIRTEDPNVPVREVTAARGKAVRAEPISTLYGKGEVDHVAGLGDLEDQMCVEMGTLIETSRGLVPVEQVTTSDWVMTRLGFAPVKWAGYTGETSQFVEIQAGSSKVRVTRCHPIFLPQKQQFAHAQHVQPLDHLLVSRNWASMVGQLRGVASGGTECHLATTGMQEASCFIGRSIKRIWAEFRKAMMCTTSMATRLITFRTTFAHLAAQSITQSTGASASMCHRTLSSLGPVSNVGPERKHDELISQTGSAQIGALSVPVASARIIELDTLAPVYNISVADGYLPEFFANGILTHNCNMTTAGYMGERSPDRVDALVWALSDLSQGKTIQIVGLV